MNNKERARDLHYKLIEGFRLDGNHNVARDLIISVLSECRSAAIDEAVKVVKADYIGTDDRYEQDCIGLVIAIKELKKVNKK